MYCYNCGAKIYNGMGSCPACHSNMSPIADVMFREAIDTIEPYCPAISADMKKQFNINGEIVAISGKNYISALCSRFISQVYLNSCLEFQKWIKQYSFDGILMHGDDEINQLALAVSYDAIAFMKKIGCDVDAKLLETKFANFFDMRHFWENLYSVAMQFEDLKEELDEARKRTKIARTSHWVGGGFGVAGAIKGMVTAELMNVGGNIANGIGNGIRSQMVKMHNNRQIDEAKEVVKNSPDFFEQMKKEWRKHIDRLYNYLQSEIRKTGKELTGEFLFMDLDLNYSYMECTCSHASTLLHKNMYDINGYINLYREKPELGNSLYEIADFLGFGVALCEKWVKHVDYKTIQSLKINDLGFGMPEEELRDRLLQVKRLENNNPIYQTQSELKLVQREQEYRNKLYQLCRDFDIR